MHYLIFIVLALLFTFPIIIKINSGIYGFTQFCGDPLGTLWWMWWYRYAWGKHVSSRFVDIVGYPFGLDRSGQPIAPLLNYPVAILNLFIRNEILTYNIAVFGGIFLTAMSMYFLVRYLTKSSTAGFLAGIIFAFCPNQLMHSAQHLGFTLNFWIPLYVLCLFRLKDFPSVKNSVLCAFTGTCTVLSNYYYGYFMLIFTVVFLLFWVRRREVVFFLWTGIMGIVILTPFIIPLLLRQGEEMAYVHPIGDLFKYSAHWYDYFLPSEFHPLFGRWAQGISRHYFERSLYIGYLPIILGLLAVIKVRDKVIRFFIFTSFLFFIFSLSPVFNICGFKIPNLSYFAYKILPMFRVYARMGILVMLSVGILAGFGLKYILERIGKGWVRGCIASLFIGIVLFEYVNFPPFHNVDLSKVPEVYEWLANEPEDIVIVEYPFVRSIEARHSEYLFYQRIHKKKIVNGMQEGTLGDAFRKECLYPDKIETARLLAYLGANYVIVHKDVGLDNIDTNPGFEFLRDFPEARVYKVVSRPSDITMVYWRNFASWEKWNDENYWRWMGNDATVWVGNGPMKIQNAKFKMQNSKFVNIEFRILAFAKERELEVYVNDALIKRLNIFAPSNSELAQKVVLKNVVLQPGENIIRFYTPQGEDRIGDVLGNSDNRRVSFGISGVEIR